jgi:alkylhydroperoxidase family enzyme
MARIPYGDPAAAPERARRAFEGAPAPLNIFRMLLNAPTCMPGFMSLGGAILARQELDPRLRELAILRVAALSRADYEWTQHVPIARACGATDLEIEAVRGGGLDALDPVAHDVVAFAEECLREVRVSDPTLERVRRHLSPREVTELVLAVGFYMLVARVLESLGVDADAPPPALAAAFSGRAEAPGAR